VIGLAVMLAASAASPATIASVRAEPERYAGQRVRLIGWINSCWAIDCGLHEKLAARPIDAGARLSFEWDRSLDRKLKPLVPAKVEIEATVDPTCIREVCLDRAPELRGVVVKRIILKRQTAPDE